MPSPTSTGSGIKTTTAYVLYNSLKSYVVGHEVSINNRMISLESKKRAYAILIVVILIIILGTTFLLMLEKINLNNALFDVVGSLSNVGITNSLINDYGNIVKLLLVVLMFIGRVGLLTMLGIFNKNWSKPNISNIEYIEEKVIVV